MFSDGYADQFGGPNGKKFMYKPFRKLLLENAEKQMEVQKQILDKAFENWISFMDKNGNQYEQIDDVVIFGIRII